MRRALVENAERLTDELLRIATTASSDADRLRAIEMLTSRVLGKPTERTEVVLDADDAIARIDSLSRDELIALGRQMGSHELLARYLPALEEAAEIVDVEDGPLPGQ